jgi:hypothetical protein
MIFDIPTTVSFLPQHTTIERGTVIMTGAGPGIGAVRNPKLSLKHGDDVRVEIDQIGTLVNMSTMAKRLVGHLDWHWCCGPLSSGLIRVNSGAAFTCRANPPHFVPPATVPGQGVSRRQ